MKKERSCSAIRKYSKYFIALPAGILGLLYGSGFIAQFIGNYVRWESAGGLYNQESMPVMPSANPLSCIKAVFDFPYGIYGITACLIAAGILIFMFAKPNVGAFFDKERNVTYSDKGTYGTAGFMNQRERAEVLDSVSDISSHTGVILGKQGSQVICTKAKSGLNNNIAVYGASGSMKTRAYCINRIFQSAAAGESLIITDPKKELYEMTAEYLKGKEYTVRIFNLVDPAHSDAWNCLAEIGGEELMAQLFCDTIITNTGSERGDYFWDNSELNLLKALSLYVNTTYPQKDNNIEQVYRLLTHSSERELNSLFEILPNDHPAKAPYNIFSKASDTVKSGVITGLGTRLGVFQNKLICNITGRNEIDLELPGKEKCAYFVVNSDQDSTFDFLSSLFLSFCFIKLARYADNECPGRKLLVPVHILGEELNACGTIPDLSRKISVIRSRSISMSCVFQNLAGLQNRYPRNQWQEILGNCDTQLFLGCTDELTAEHISNRTGIASVAVSSEAKKLSTLRFTDYTPEFREVSSVGRRNVLTVDEVLRLDLQKALVILRGHKVLEIEKYDYTLHPESQFLIPCKASEYIPEWSSQKVFKNSKQVQGSKSGASELLTDTIQMKSEQLLQDTVKHTSDFMNTGNPGSKKRIKKIDKNSFMKQ